MTTDAPAFSFRAGEGYLENCALAAIAETVGTPCYIYSRETIEQQWLRFDQAFAELPLQLCYAVKANSSIAILNLLAHHDAGFDIVSGGELARVLRAGGNPAKIIFSGVGKQSWEIEAALKAGIGCFNVESIEELHQLNQLAATLETTAPIALRVNPDIPVETHPYIATGLKENKFGIPWQAVMACYELAAQLPYLRVVGIACHIGSQIMQAEPFIQALDKLLEMVDALREKNILLQHVDIGGGFGLAYTHGASDLDIHVLTRPFAQRLQHRALKLMIAPGRAIVAQAGILLTRVLLLKDQAEKKFAIVDAAMNDLIRPALYEAWHNIIPTHLRQIDPQIYDVVGPVCETGDFLGKQRKLAILPNDLLAITMAGAYGFVMSSNYNTRPRPPEVMVDSDQYYIIRPRETIEELFTKEICLP